MPIPNVTWITCLSAQMVCLQRVADTIHVSWMVRKMLGIFSGLVLCLIAMLGAAEVAHNTGRHAQVINIFHGLIGRTCVVNLTVLGETLQEARAYSCRTASSGHC